MGSAELGEERIRGLRWLRPQEAINRSCPERLVATDKSPECTARKGQDDYTAIRPMWGTAAVEICSRRKRQKTVKVKCLCQNITQARDGSRAIGTG